MKISGFVIAKIIELHKFGPKEFSSQTFGLGPKNHRKFGSNSTWNRALNNIKEERTFGKYLRKKDRKAIGY
jgi:hypothetical protein